MNIAGNVTAREWTQQSVCIGIGRSTKTTLLVFALAAALIAGMSGCAPHRAGSRRPPIQRKPSDDQIREKIQRVRQLVMDQLGTPYLYGGQTTEGFDCSGLVWYVYRKVGIKLPRTALNQSRSGRGVSLDKLRPGDLVFFKMERDIISHVGVYVGDDAFVHAPGTGKFVRKDSLQNRWWRSRVGAVRRIITPQRR